VHIHTYTESKSWKSGHLCSETLFGALLQKCVISSWQKITGILAYKKSGVNVELHMSKTLNYLVIHNYVHLNVSHNLKLYNDKYF